MVAGYLGCWPGCWLHGRRQGRAAGPSFAFRVPPFFPRLLRHIPLPYPSSPSPRPAGRRLAHARPRQRRTHRAPTRQRNAWRTPFFCNPIVHCTLVNRARALSRGSIQPRYKKSIQLSVGCSFFSEKINFRSRFSFPFELRRECFRVNFFHSRRRSNGITVASLRLYRLFHDS